MMIEPDAFDERWIGELRSKGHTVQIGKRRWGNMQLIFYDKNPVVFRNHFFAIPCLQFFSAQVFADGGFIYAEKEA